MDLRQINKLSIAACEKAIKDADVLFEMSKSPEKGTQVRLQLQSLDVKLNAVKQLNNVRKIAFLEDQASVRFTDYVNQFLDDEERHANRLSQGNED